MAYAPAVSPYTPHADMSGWGRALMEIMGQKDAKAEQAKQKAQTFKTYVAMGKQIGLNPDELTTKDLGTVKGMVEGHITKTNLERAMEDSNVRNQAAYANILRDTAAVNAANRGQAEQAAGLAAVPGFMADLAREPDNFVEAPLTQQQRMVRAMENNPNIRFVPGNTMMSQMLESAMKGGDGAADYQPVPFEVNGLKGLVSPRTGAIHVAGGGNQTGLTFDQRVDLIDRSALQKERGQLSKLVTTVTTGPMFEAANQRLQQIDSALGAQGAGGGDANAPGETDIAYLKAHPELKGAFEARFGKGTAGKYVK